MDEEVRKDILSILDGVIQAFSSYDPDAIMNLSDHIIHSASIFQERYTSMIAIVVYSIGKIMSIGKVRRYPQEAWNVFESTVRDNLRRAHSYLEENDFKNFDKCMINLQAAVMALDESFMSYANYVIDNAKLKKGAKMYEHGVSLRRVAELFGVSEWELMSYAGKMRILERDEAAKSEVPDRLKKVRRLFE